MTETLSDLIKICNHNLKNSKDCVDYLNSRGFSHYEIEKYSIGFFPQNLNILRKFVNFDKLNSLNIIKSNNDSDFKNYYYLTIPIFNEYGTPIGISGRSLMDEKDLKVLGLSKYKNSSYKKKDVLFGLDKSVKSIVDKNSVWVVEGYFDQISMHKYGCKNVVALGGTAFTRSHFMRLKRYCNKINFLFDNDEAGYTSAKRVYGKFNKYDVNLNFYKLNKYKDIDEYLYDNKSLSSLKSDIGKINF